MKTLTLRPEVVGQVEWIALESNGDADVEGLIRRFESAKWLTELSHWCIPLDKELCRRLVEFVKPVAGVKLDLLRDYLEGPSVYLLYRVRLICGCERRSRASILKTWLSWRKRWVF